MVYTNFSDKAGAMTQRAAPFQMAVKDVRRELVAREKRQIQRRRIALAIAMLAAFGLAALIWRLCAAV
ncbi:MAG: hypothetical protein ACTHLA_08635 [Asticcacaulis sp.]|uniref:hypothetical protein n=1 Tax=Asticcacaulis sp. TaxID=1872648 RepID=UPI003F7B838B